MNNETEEQRHKRLWEWYRIFNGFDLRFEWFHEVLVTELLVDNICSQLDLMKGIRNVFFLPGDRDRELWESCFPQRKEIQKRNQQEYEKTKGFETSDYHDTGTHHDDHIIGSLTSVARNVGGYIDPKIPDAQVKIEIDDKFKLLPIRAYGLHVGLDSNFTKFKPQKNPHDFKEKFEIESCKVKGLYFKELDNFNHFDPTLTNYYGLRALGMFIYVPGRCYY